MSERNVDSMYWAHWVLLRDYDTCVNDTNMHTCEWITNMYLNVCDTDIRGVFIECGEHIVNDYATRCGCHKRLFTFFRIDKGISHTTFLNAEQHLVTRGRFWLVSYHHLSYSVRVTIEEIVVLYLLYGITHHTSECIFCIREIFLTNNSHEQI